MDGVLNINKPAGMTSHDVVNKLRWILKEKKVGHTGTLDPDATGVLLICLGKATRIMEYLQDHEKTYEGTVILGVATDTLDSKGKILSVCESNNFDHGRIRGVFHSFKGEIKQIPPMVSAIKIQGKRLYELAREGKTVNRDPRPVEIYDLEIISIYEGKADRVDPSMLFTKIDFQVRCSKGTYVRSLAADIGNALGYGAHLSRLVRTKSGGFDLKDSISLEDIKNDPEIAFCAIKSIDEALSFMPVITLTKLAGERFLNGGFVYSSGVKDYPKEFQKGKITRVHDEARNFLGICEAVESNTMPLDPKTVICKTLKVLK